MQRPLLNSQSTPALHFFFLLIHYTWTYIPIWKKICRYFHFIATKHHFAFFPKWRQSWFLFSSNLSQIWVTDSFTNKNTTRAFQLLFIVCVFANQTILQSWVWLQTKADVARQCLVSGFKVHLSYLMLGNWLSPLRDILLFRNRQSLWNCLFVVVEIKKKQCLGLPIVSKNKNDSEDTFT